MTAVPNGVKTMRFTMGPNFLQFCVCSYECLGLTLFLLEPSSCKRQILVHWGTVQKVNEKYDDMSRGLKSDVFFYPVYVVQNKNGSIRF